MELPFMSAVSRSRSLLSAFGGYCHTPACSDGQFYNMENLSARDAPLLRPRPQRGKIRQFNQP